MELEEVVATDALAKFTIVPSTALLLANFWAEVWTSAPLLSPDCAAEIFSSNFARSNNSRSLLLKDTSQAWSAAIKSSCFKFWLAARSNQLSKKKHRPYTQKSNACKKLSELRKELELYEHASQESAPCRSQARAENTKRLHKPESSAGIKAPESSTNYVSPQCLT